MDLVVSSELRLWPFPDSFRLTLCMTLGARCRTGWLPLVIPHVLLTRSSLLSDDEHLLASWLSLPTSEVTGEGQGPGLDIGLEI